MLKGQNKLAEREFFDKQTKRGSLADWRYKSFIDFFLKHSNLKQNARILDLGCGRGAFGRYFLKKGFQVIGLDLSLGMLKQARNYFPVIYGDAENIPFLDNSFDAVIGGGIIHHFPNPENLLNEVARILKKGGYFFTEDPNMLNPGVFLFYSRISPFRLNSSVNENPISPFYLKRVLRNRFEVVKIQNFSFVMPKWNLSKIISEIYIGVEKLLQKTLAQYLFIDTLSVNRKL